MTKLQKLSVNVKTGEETLIDLTADEVTDFEASVKALEDETVAAKAKIKSDAETKAALLAKKHAPRSGMRVFTVPDPQLNFQVKLTLKKSRVLCCAKAAASACHVLRWLQLNP